MAAATGNKNAEKWTEDAVMGKLNLLLKLAKTTTYIGEGLAKIGLYHQWFSEMSEKFKESEIVSDTIKAIEQSYEARLVAKALKGDFNSTMAIFTLKNKHMWKDKSEFDHTSKGEKIGQTDLSKYTDDELRTIADLQRKGRTSEA